ncbi:MAG: helix-turn-helix domain-containing protein [Tannerellaceae bacterium]|jgi:AraC-like DNA-binding protein|nr:helix-turn-helix domain-containing protein [Tannerellaceae bacterium]
MKFVYENPKIKSKLILCDTLEKDMELLRDKTLYKFIWITDGEVELIINHESMTFHAGEVVSLSYLHHLKLGKVDGKYRTMLFNDRFYHIIDHDSEVLCNGLLFNGSLNVISFRVSEKDAEKFYKLTTAFLEELAVHDSMQDEMLRLILKRTIILCCRMARNKHGVLPQNCARFETMRKFHALVDEHFREKKQVQDYADMLHKSPKTLANVLSYYHQPSAIKVIHNRIVAEAERLLYYTSKSSKEIALLLGFEEHSMFSRFFKNATGISATEYRQQSHQLRLKTA